MSEEPKNLAEGLQQELIRAREAKQIYLETPNGQIGAALIEGSIQNAEAAILSGDVIRMLQAYEDLKGIEL